jgi:hypothetical protein
MALLYPPPARPGFSVLNARWRILLACLAFVLSIGWASAAHARETRFSSDVIDDSAVPDLHAPPLAASFISQDAGWIRLAYPPSVRDRVAPVIAEADDVRATLAAALGRSVLDRVEVRIARTGEQMASLAPEGLPPDPSSNRALYPRLRLVVLALFPAGSSDPADLDELFRHELSHLALLEATRDHKVPLWLTEGLATHVAEESSLSRARSLWFATTSGRLLAIDQLDWELLGSGGTSDLALAQGADLVRFLTTSSAHGRLPAAIDKLDASSFGDALAAAYGAPVTTLERDWRAQARWRYGWVPALSMLGIVAVGIGVAQWVARSRRRNRAAIVVRRNVASSPPPASARNKGRVHIVIRRQDERVDPAMLAEPEIPKVEHDGQWHTLH